jgi:hypothetical protein
VEAELKGHTDSGNVCCILSGRQASRLWIGGPISTNLECDNWRDGG